MGESTQCHRVLYIEDNHANIQLMLRIFERIPNAELVLAPNAEEGIKLANSEPPDLILMDMRMPIMDGYEASRRIKALSKQTTIIAVTASVFRDKKNQVLEAGCDDFIAKPFRHEDIFTVIQKHLGVKYIYETTPLLDVAAEKTNTLPKKDILTLKMRKILLVENDKIIR